MASNVHYKIRNHKKDKNINITLKQCHTITAIKESCTISDKGTLIKGPSILDRAGAGTRPQTHNYVLNCKHIHAKSLSTLM